MIFRSATEQIVDLYSIGDISESEQVRVLGYEHACAVLSGSSLEAPLYNYFPSACPRRGVPSGTSNAPS